MIKNRAKVEFAALSQNEAFARAFAVAFISQIDPTVEELMEIKTAVSEAVSNSIIHGYSGGSIEKSIVMECSYSESGAVTVIISDFGIGIENIEEARKPLFTTGNTEERSGMGFTVMESFMDKVMVQSKIGEGTRVTLIKALDAGYDI